MENSSNTDECLLPVVLRWLVRPNLITKANIGHSSLSRRVLVEGVRQLVFAASRNSARLVKLVCQVLLAHSLRLISLGVDHLGFNRMKTVQLFDTVLKF